MQELLKAALTKTGLLSCKTMIFISLPARFAVQLRLRIRLSTGYSVEATGAAAVNESETCSLQQWVEGAGARQ